MFSTHAAWELDTANAETGRPLQTAEPAKDDDDELAAEPLEEASWPVDGALSLSADGRRRVGDDPDDEEDLNFSFDDFDDDEDVDDDDDFDDFDDDDFDDDEDEEDDED